MLLSCNDVSLQITKSNTINTNNLPETHQKEVFASSSHVPSTETYWNVNLLAKKKGSEWVGIYSSSPINLC